MGEGRESTEEDAGAAGLTTADVEGAQRVARVGKLVARNGKLIVEQQLLEVLEKARYMIRQTTKKKSDTTSPSRQTLFARVPNGSPLHLVGESMPPCHPTQL